MDYGDAKTILTTGHHGKTASARTRRLSSLPLGAILAIIAAVAAAILIIAGT